MLFATLHLIQRYSFRFKDKTCVILIVKLALKQTVCLSLKYFSALHLNNSK